MFKNIKKKQNKNISGFRLQNEEKKFELNHLILFFLKRKLEKIFFLFFFFCVKRVLLKWNIFHFHGFLR